MRRPSQSSRPEGSHAALCVGKVDCFFTDRLSGISCGVLDEFGLFSSEVFRHNEPFSKLLLSFALYSYARHIGRGIVGVTIILIPDDNLSFIVNVVPKYSTT